MIYEKVPHASVGPRPCARADCLRQFLRGRHKHTRRQRQPAAGKHPSSPDGEGTLGKYAVKFTGYTLAKDYQGQDTVIISFDFTNNNENATSAMVALNIDAYQDGIELESAILTDAPEGYDSESEMKNIKQGATLNCQKAFVLSNTSSPVEVEAEELFSFSSDKVVCTYAIAD